jgi:hypothetical protein
VGDGGTLLDRDEDYDDLGMALADPLSGLDPVHPGHSHVHKHELRFELVDGVHRLLAGRRGAHPAEARSRRDDVPGHVEEDRMVVDREHSNAVRGGGTHPGDGRGRPPAERHPIGVNSHRRPALTAVRRVQGGSWPPSLLHPILMMRGRPPFRLGGGHLSWRT